MSDFLQDVWNDLREKRLWPLAVALLLGIVAIPAVLTESAAEPTASQIAPATPAEPDAKGVDLEVVDIAGGGSGSALDTLASKNPFKPPAKVMRSGKDAASASSADGGGGAADGGGGKGTPGSDDGGGSDDPQAPVAPPTTTEYQYVADITFWDGDRKRTIRGLRKLDMLPNESAPVLIFMGATSDGGDAVFLVDSTLKTAGEGNCRPSGSNCAFVAIGPGAQHMFTSDSGESYRLRVDEIRRVKVTASTAKASAPTATTAVGGTDEGRGHFNLPTLTDLIEVTSGGETTQASTGEADRGGDAPR